VPGVLDGGIFVGGADVGDQQVLDCGEELFIV
jgi:hypothetical protein